MKKIFCMILPCVVTPFLWANNCDALRQTMAQHDPAAAFLAYTEARNNFCFKSESQRERIEGDIMRHWGDMLFQKIFAGDAVKLDKAQIERLREEHDAIRMAAEQAGTSTSWQILFLQAMLDLDRNPEALLNEKMYQRFDSIIYGYLRDEEQQTLSVIAKSARVDNFMQELAEAQILYIPDDKLKQLNKTRGDGNSALTRLIAHRSKMRGVHLASSAEQSITAITPIRFAYDSISLTAQGETEYRENLGIMQANTTRSIFLIGHTDSKGEADYNCRLSQCRVEALRDRLIADGIPAASITIAWAGENIPLEFASIGEFLQTRDILIIGDKDDDSVENPSRRRVEYEINGNTLQEKYRSRFCRVTPAYAAQPCKP